jgi:hypothetical protein
MDKGCDAGLVLLAEEGCEARARGGREQVGKLKAEVGVKWAMKDHVSLVLRLLRCAEAAGALLAGWAGCCWQVSVRLDAQGVAAGAQPGEAAAVLAVGDCC